MTLEIAPINFLFKPVFLKVGRIAPLGAIVNGKGVKKPKGAKMLNH